MEGMLQLKSVSFERKLEGNLSERSKSMPNLISNILSKLLAILRNMDQHIL